jgi:rhodanese-related sulfurtransferase
VAPLRQIDPQRASQIINQPQVLLLDVRTEEEYRDGHIERAVFLPITELEKRLNELPPDKNAAIEL